MNLVVQNFLKPEFWKPVIDYVGGTVVECNTAYDGARNTTAKHMKTMHEHGWSKYFEVDLLDAEGPDMELPIPNGKVIHKNSCLDLVYASDDPGRDHLIERIESRNGVHTIEAAADLGFGTREYELITVS